MPTYESDYQLGDKVWLDGDTDLPWTVIAIQLAPTEILHISFCTNAEVKSFWVDAWRIALAKSVDEIDYPRLGSG